uniref:Transposase n=1 Tax=Haemonchus placei TaxID=6290 RepID=A0A0N4WUP8_HAEPC
MDDAQLTYAKTLMDELERLGITMRHSIHNHLTSTHMTAIFSEAREAALQGKNSPTVKKSSRR